MIVVQSVARREPPSARFITSVTREEIRRCRSPETFSDLRDIVHCSVLSRSGSPLSAPDATPHIANDTTPGILIQKTIAVRRGYKPASSSFWSPLDEEVAERGSLLPEVENF